jgi:hypothetical protein
MKRTFLILLTAVALAASLVALPLTVTIFQESARLKAKVAAWTKQCGSKTEYDETCTKRRHALSKELGEFVALVNDEISFIRSPISPDAGAEFAKEIEGRRKIMEHEVRVALHDMKCLGLPASDPQCIEEVTAIESEKAGLDSEYALTHQHFDGKWISIPVSSVSVAPKKR